VEVTENSKPSSYCGRKRLYSTGPGCLQERGILEHGDNCFHFKKVKIIPVKSFPGQGSRLALHAKPMEGKMLLNVIQVSFS